MTRARDLAALLLLLIGLGCVWHALDISRANRQPSNIRFNRSFRGREFPEWWPLDWPPVTSVTISTPGSSPRP